MNAEQQTTRPASLDQTRLESELAEIRRIVSTFYGIPRSDLTSRRRTEPLATQRQVAMYIARKITQAPNQKIACSFARRDHGTAAHASLVIPDKMMQIPLLRSDVEKLMSQCQNALLVLR